MIFDGVIQLWLLTCLVLRAYAQLNERYLKEFSKKEAAVFASVICSNPEKVEDSKYLLYTRDNPLEPTYIDQNHPQPVRVREKNVLITHGWISNPRVANFQAMKDKYLERYDANVFMLDWSKAANDVFELVYCKLPTVAQKATEVLCNIGIPMSSFHLVGHSYGAQVSGFIGQDVQNTCKSRVDRITGLDPAWPLFNTNDTSKRLDPTDASFVDIIHSNEGMTGFFGKCGHIDFHPNCGTFQPGCPNVDFTIVDHFLKWTLEDIACSHTRSIDLMVESITSRNFIAQSCSQCQIICEADKAPEYIIMGEDCPRTSKRDDFNIPTNSKPPYAAGCSLYPNGCK